MALQATILFSRELEVMINEINHHLGSGWNISGELIVHQNSYDGNLNFYQKMIKAKD